MNDLSDDVDVTPTQEVPVKILVPDYKVKPYWQDGVPDDVYHGDRSAVSSSQLRKMLKSPATFKAHFNGGLSNKETKSLMFGRLLHQVVLEDAMLLKSYAVMPSFKEYGHPNSKDHRAAKAAWLLCNSDKAIVKAEELGMLHGMLESIYSNRDAMLLLRNGRAEVSGYYVDPETGVRCRVRPDFTNTHVNAIVDLKSTEDCDYREFQRSIMNYHYHFQLAMYGAGYEAIEAKAPDHYVFIAIEKTAPYECAVYDCDKILVQKGLEEYRSCLYKLRQCIDKDSWPRAHQSSQIMSLPQWAL